MASITLTIEVPDAVVPLARRTLARMTGDPVPTTAAETRAIIEKYLKQKLKSDAQQTKQEEAQAAAVTDTSDGLLDW